MKKLAWMLLILLFACAGCDKLNSNNQNDGAVSGESDSTKSKNTKRTLKGIADACRQYHSNYNIYPNTLEDLMSGI